MNETIAKPLNLCVNVEFWDFGKFGDEEKGL